MKAKFMLTTLLVVILACVLVMITTARAADVKEGETVHGFRLVDKQYVEEVNAECLRFEHVKSGAQVFKILSDDDNKTFSVTFKTLPPNDTGLPHIMEHSVLNGSKNFPVKSPFDVLMQGSLNTFLNAMTASDWTMYPVSSKNMKDYFNLMHVYLDAVFNPLIYEDPRILKQEGWHYELDSKDGELVYKGVVYNEMKGAFSSPTRELYYQIDKNLFPDTIYGNSSGGYPTAIPELSYEEFINFHETYYHPSNARILLYGDANVMEELEFIDKAYLSNYDRKDVDATIKLQKPFDAMKEVTGVYPLPAGSDTTDQTFLALSIVAGQSVDRDLTMALDVLTDVLVNQESAPLRLALQEAEIGKDVSAGLTDTKQNVVQIIVKNANPEDTERFKELVYNTLRDVAANGIDKRALEGTINRLEFRLREGNDANKGLMYNFRMLNGWLYADDPFLSLRFEEPLKTLRNSLENNWLESIIREQLVNNPHTLLMTMKPEPGLEQMRDEQIDQELTAYKAGLTDEELAALVQETKDLLAYQQEDDTPEELATIPMLELEDINTKAKNYPLAEHDVEDATVLHYSTFTNNIYYTQFIFDLNTIPQEDVQYAALLAEVLGSLNTENYSYGELDNVLNIHTGGFSSYTDTYLENMNSDKPLPKFMVSIKAMDYKLDKLFELTAEILNKTVYDDRDRLQDVLERHQSRLDSRIKRDGISYAMRRLESYYSQDGMFQEKTDGYDYYRFVTELTENFDSQADEIIEKLQQTANRIFNRNSAVVAVSCSDANMVNFNEHVPAFFASLNDAAPQFYDYQFELEPKNEAFLTASQVQYVVQGYNLNKLGYDFDGNLYVLNQVLSRDYLQNTIRVMGGAYGGFAGFGRDGLVYFASYRDPNLQKTLENYDAAPKFLQEFDVDESTMTRFIIGTIARMDRPLTPDQQGKRALSWHFSNTKYDDMQMYRDQVLSTTPEDIRALTGMVQEILKQNIYCVYGSESKIEENKELFKGLIKLSE